MEGPFAVGSHHLARCMAALGHQVVHITVPVTLLHLFKVGDRTIRARFRNWIDGGHARGEHLLDYVPFGLFPWAIAERLAVRANMSIVWIPTVRRLLKCRGIEHVDVLLVDDPRMTGIELRVMPDVTVYRATDLYSEMRGDPRIVEFEKTLADRADLLIGTSALVVEHLRSLGEDKTPVLIENGVEFERFSDTFPRPTEYQGLQGPILVYVGALDKRLDFDVVRHLARTLPKASIVMIGPVSAKVVSEVRDCANVIFLGARPYETTPAYLGHADIGLLPTGSHPANSGRSPMKLYEYAAARLPVVAMRTVELERRALPFVHLSDSKEGFASAVKALVDDPGLRANIGERARDSARKHDWHVITRQLLSLIEVCAADKVHRQTFEPCGEGV
jgi:glycosyltransferase involved in cell wall biosynthesis